MAPSAPAEPAAPSPLLPWLLLAALFAVPIVVTARPVGVPILDPDIWWHLQVGQWVTEHRAVPETDPFSQIGPERRWVAYSWLYEVTVYAFHARLALAGIVVFRLLLAVAIVAAVVGLVRRLEPRFLVAVLLAGLATLTLAALFSERPWLFTVLFATLTLRVIVEFRDPECSRLPWGVWLLPLAYVVWANVHIQFVYGLFLLALAVVAPLAQPRLDAWLGLAPAADDSARRAGTRRWRQLIALAALCFVATLVTPYHVRLYGVIVEYATQPGPFRWVNELKALEFREPSDWVMLGLTAAACYALGRRRPEAFELGLLASTAVFAFRARRDLWFVVLADLVVLASFAPREIQAEQRFRAGRVGLAILSAALLALAALLFRVRGLNEDNLNAKVATVFPARAVDFVQLRGYRGPLFNDFNWGGYLIWTLPQLPVAIDGRTNLYGDERIERYGRVWSGLPGWQNDPDLSAAALVIAPHDTALVSLLAFDERFLLVYEDELASVFVRQDRQR